MQRYRVNLPLLIGLVVGSIVLIGGGYGLYKFQRARNADRLLERATAAREDGDLRREAALLGSYLGIRVNEEEAMSRLSLTMAEIAEQPDAERKDIGKAIGFLETTVRNYPERDDLRRRLVDFYMKHGGLKQAIDHISQLLNQNPNDPELEGMLSQCYFASGDSKAFDHALELIGYNEATETFDVSKAIAPDNTGAYLRVARVFRTEKLNEELADRTVDQMVEANPESGEALLARGQYLESIDRKDEAVKDFEAALQLDPEEPRIITANARLAAREEQYDKATELLENGLTDSPDDAGLYQVLAEVEIRQGNFDEAIAACDRGIAAVPKERGVFLLLQKARLQIQGAELADAKKTIKQMRDVGVPNAFPEYLEAQLLMREDKTFEAAKVFEKYQPFFSNNPIIGPELNNLLGLCREKLGQKELALEAFNSALQINPEDRAAQAGRDRLTAQLGGRSRGEGGQSIYGMLAIELAKPESEQDWEAFDAKCVEYIDRMNLDEAMLEVLRGEVDMRRGKYVEAREHLIGSYNLAPKNLGVRRAAVKLFAADPEQGPVKALKLLDKVVKDFGDLPILRLERADLLSVINDENLTEQLFDLTEGIEDWNTGQKVQLWKGLASKFERLRKEDERLECLRQVAELSPGDLATMLDLFNVALEAGDDTGMQNAQEAILKVVGNKENPTWLYTEARRQLAKWRAASGEGDGIDRAEALVERALAQRAEWHLLHNLQAELALARGDTNAALASYRTASDLGRQDPTTIYRYVKLLMLRGRYTEALAQMEKLNRDGRLRLLGRDYAQSLLRVGRAAEGIDVAEQFAAQAPNNSAVQLWLGRFLSQASVGEGVSAERQKTLVAKAGEAFAEAVSSPGATADAWLALVGYYASTGQMVKADDTVREAQLALVEDQTQLLFARCYEMVGRGIDAEALYLQALEDVDETQRARVARLAAQFYLGPAYRRDDKIQRATPLINQVLEDAANGLIEPSDPHARWARSTAARLLASGGEYRKLLDAEKLLSTNAQDGVLPVEDRLLMAQILAPRPEPVSRLKAARLLEDVSQDQQLSKQSELDLGKLYYALGEWRKCRQQMITLIGRYPEDKTIRLAYLNMLMKRGGTADIDQAVRQVGRLKQIAPGDLATREMLAMIANEKGKKKEAVKTLLSVLPRDASKITAKQVPLIKRIAARLVGFDDIDRARKLYELAAKLGGPNEKLELAQFIGTHVSAEEGLDGIEALRGDTPAQLRVQRGIQVLRAVESKEGEIGEEQFARIEGWLAEGLREDPELIPLQMQRAELADLRRDYDKAEKAYKELLEREDLAGLQRAVVLNNLAYLLALAQKDGASIKEAEEYTSQAIDILGPNSDILDTRAVIANADGRYDDALKDLELAVIDGPTASKYFHMATALIGTGNQSEATEAWQEALDRGLTRESISRLEREQFDRLKGQIGSAGG